MRSPIPKHQFYLSNCILAKLYCLAHTLKISKYLHKYKKNCVLAAIVFLSTHILASKPSICYMLPCCIFSLTLSHIFVAIAALLLVPPALAHCSWGGSYNSARFVSNAVIFLIICSFLHFSVLRWLKSNAHSWYLRVSVSIYLHTCTFFCSTYYSFVSFSLTEFRPIFHTAVKQQH